MFPTSCDTFVALPPSTAGPRVVFAKNSDRPEDEVQEVVYFPAGHHEPGDKVQCTYIEVDQAPHTHAVVLSRPAWLWGAEMGANEHQVCIGNEAVWGRESSDVEEALLGMDLVRLGLERADTAEGAVQVITDLLGKHGQGGPCMEDDCSFTYHNSFLISDRTEAWILETAGQYWAAERMKDGSRNISNEYSIGTSVDKEHPGLREYARARGWWDGTAVFNFSQVFSYKTTARIEAAGTRYCEGKRMMEKSDGHITAQTMMEILRDKESGINMEGAFLTTGSMVSVVPRDPTLPGVHYFTGTPDPERSVFKPFIFVDDIKQLKHTCSPCYGPDDPAKQKPRFKSKPDRKHPLFIKHQITTDFFETHKERGEKVIRNMRELEREKMAQMETFLVEGVKDTTLVVNLFSDTAEQEMKAYSKND
ncbi:hypothetical protein NHX12_007099 [Muraenolepis orangiensis]|uniref:Secernin-3 n=1 Tax=Muraenolepis orangiensis TaxID=630683 RepID=A0A9Q0IAU7_9TELE|nr:hypothetical protein NHX12_007099 [Muraenolepis orangiensis]